MNPINPQKITLNIHEPDLVNNFQEVELAGEIDRDSMANFRDQMEAFLASFQGINLVLNLEKFMFTNSEGIGYLSDIHNRFDLQNKHLFIIKASSRIMDIFLLVGLNQIIPCYSTIDELIQNIKQNK